MLEIIKTYFGTTRHRGAVCKVRIQYAYRCTKCGLIGFKRNEMVYHNCEEYTNEVPDVDFRRTVDGVRFEP